MRKYGKWVLVLGLLAATPSLTLAAGPKSKVDDRPAAGKKATKSDNQKVAEDIASALRGKVQGEGVGIEYKDGVAVLSGSVADQKVKNRASSLAGKVAGVDRVDNRMSVVEAKRKYTSRLSDQSEDRGGVVSANHESSGRRGAQIQQVNGEVSSGAIGGNQEVAEQIGAALTQAQLDGYDIQIRYQNGVATLDGSVGTQQERATASQVVSSIPGVRSVSNRLSCSQEPVRPVAGQRPQYGQPNPYAQGNPYTQGYPQGVAPVGYRQAGPMPGAAPMGPGGPMPPSYGHPGAGGPAAVYNNPSVPDYAWPSYAQYPNSAAVNYPTQYSASAWPYIGPFYPYPQVPLGWRDATLRWDDGQWNLMFRPRTDKWWWFMNPNNW